MPEWSIARQRLVNSRSIEMRISGNRLGTERAFHVNGINNFHGYALDYIRSRAEKNDPFVKQSSFKAVALEVIAS
jgi:hypothetical protein